MNLNALHLKGCPCRNASCHPPCIFCICESLKPKPQKQFVVVLVFNDDADRPQKYAFIGEPVLTREAAEEHLAAQRRLVYGPDAPLAILTREVSGWRPLQ